MAQKYKVNLDGLVVEIFAQDPFTFAHVVETLVKEHDLENQNISFMFTKVKANTPIVSVRGPLEQV